MNVFDLPDDEFMKQSGPPAVTASEPNEKPTTPEAEVVEETTTTEVGTSVVDTPNPEAEEPAEGGDVVPPVEAGKPTQKEVTSPEAATVGPAVAEGDKEPVGKEVVPPVGSKETPAVVAPNYQEDYSKLMAPFKANGKTITPKSPEEARQLMQMGANFTKKMQELVPHRKIITMLQNNGLMDEAQLSFLIDVSKKDPAAIQKLLKDGGIDPLSIDTTTESAYKDGNHLVSDETVNFQTALEELTSTPEGKETVVVMHKDWDQASKDVLWKNPQLFDAIHTQRQNGIYDRIVEEYDRQKVLGKFPASVSFLQAYKAIGDELQAKNAFADLAPKAPAVRQPIATKTVVKPVVKNDKANAASPSRSAPALAKTPVNHFAMADDDFLASMKNRV